MPAALTPPVPARPVATGEILVVDDNPANVRLLTDLLRVHGFSVRSAADGPACLAAIATKQPDLVLLDVIMPGMDGFTVCRTLRADRRHQMLPVVLVTSCLLYTSPSPRD